jgi:hypothetical protein
MVRDMVHSSQSMGIKRRAVSRNKAEREKKKAVSGRIQFRRPIKADRTIATRVNSMPIMIPDTAQITIAGTSLITTSL